MLRAIIFDFNGVILDDEPCHFRSMRDAAAAFGIRITREEYYDNYLPLDDAGCLEAICRNHSLNLTAGQKTDLLQQKARLYADSLGGSLPFREGVGEFIRESARRYPLALASGASRAEIAGALAPGGLLDCFRVVLGAGDFTVGKPAPESYLQALKELNKSIGSHSAPIMPRECLVIEDSIAGIAGARTAGMVCLAVAGTYPLGKLAAADRVAASLTDVTLDSLQELFERQS